jgi:uncharacterized protein (TIGR02996 family)
MPVQRAEPPPLLPPTLRMPVPDPEPEAPIDSATLARDPVERSLIDAITSGDEDSRLVYADWLETRGDALRAEFLRLQRKLAGMEPTDPSQRDLLKERMQRLGELAPQIDFAWRRLLGRPVVEGCRSVVTDFKCKMDWGSLQPTDRPNVRRCDGCGDNVYYVSTLRAAREQARMGRCIVVDFSQERSPNDLADPVLAMRSPMPAPGWR